MSEFGQDSVHFGGFEFRFRDNALLRDGEVVPIPPRAAELLSLLIRDRNNIVSKQQIMDSVWADSFVTDANLTQTVYTLRRTLGKNAEEKDFIETVPRRGYRFVLASADEKHAEKSPNFENLFPPAAARPKKSRRLGMLVLAGGVLVLFLSLALLPLFFKDFLSRSRTAQTSNADISKLTFSGDINYPTLSPDGKSFAFIRGGNIFVQDASNGSNYKVTVNGHSTFGNLQFTPDGENIAFRNESRSDAAGSIFTVSRFGGAAREVAQNAWSGGGFSPDGKRVAFIRFLPETGDWSLVVRGSDSGEEKALTTVKLPETLFHLGFPAFSNDGKQIAFVTQLPNQKTISHLKICDAETGAVRDVETPKLLQIEQAIWSPDNAALILLGRENNRFFQIWRCDISSNELTRVSNDLNIYRAISLSADGKKLLARQQTLFGHIWTANAENLSEQKQITNGNLNRDGVNGFSWLPDGNLIYATRITGNTDVWKVNADSGATTQLTNDAGNINQEPSAAADGKTIVFESNRSSGRHIWRMDGDGKNAAQITFDEANTDRYPRISPDGSAVFYVEKSAKTTVLVRRSLVNEESRVLTDAGIVSPETSLSISPDGKFLAFSAIGNDAEKSGFRVGIMPTDGGEIKYLAVDAANDGFAFSQESNSIIFVKNTGGKTEIWKAPIDASAPQKLAQIETDNIFHIAFSQDGKRAAFSRGRQMNDAVLMENF